MRDRLIELKIQFVENFYCGDCKPSNDKCRKCLTEKEADYLLENGIIVPPCKVGDTVYEFFDIRGFYDISELVVENIVVGINPLKCNIYCKSKMSGSKSIFYQDSFGKTLFFTKEDAEKIMQKERCAQ